jgi:hypothetical protein
MQESRWVDQGIRGYPNPELFCSNLESASPAFDDTRKESHFDQQTTMADTAIRVNSKQFDRC